MASFASIDHLSGQRPLVFNPGVKTRSPDPLSDNKNMTYITDNLPPHHVTQTLQALDVSASTHPPRVLILYGSLREKSNSRYLAEESERVLQAFGAETRIFRPHDLPTFNRDAPPPPEARRLRDLSIWSEAHVWISPEQHGAMTAVFKNQIDWIPLAEGAVRPTQGRCLAVMQVSGGSQSFNAVNQMRILGRWMRMVTIPNQSSVAKAWLEFDEDGRMRASSYRERVVDVLEELFRFTLLIRDRKDFLSTRTSEQKS